MDPPKITHACTLTIYFFLCDEGRSSPYINHFLQPDSVIPSLYNAQALNRFSYVYNRPINFSDPNGHDPWWCEGNDLCMFTWMEDHTTPGGGGYFAEYGVEVDPTMDKRERRDIMAAIFAVGEKFANQRAKGESAGDAFTAVYDSITFKKTTDYDKGCVTESAYKVSCAKFSWDQPQSSVNNIVHELGHVLNNLKGGGAYDFGWSYADRDVRKAILRPRTNGVDWQQNDLYDPRDPLTTGGEMFGDMLVAWVFNAWNTDPRNNDAVEDALTDMNVNMAQWIN